LKLEETYRAKVIEKYKNMILEKEFHPIVIWQKFKKIVVSSSRILLLHFPIKDQVER
jgi:calcineurin-like phosphoesterase family protein